MGKRKSRKGSAIGSDDSFSHGWKFLFEIVGALAFLIGSGALYSWLDKWDEVDKNSNLVLDVISMGDHEMPISAETDSWFAFRRVAMKSRIIQKMQSKFHPKEKSTYSGARNDIAFYDREAWAAAIHSYRKIEERIHPSEYKKVAWSTEWKKLDGEVTVAAMPNAAQTRTQIPLSLLMLAVTGGRNAGDGSQEQVQGVFMNTVPVSAVELGYPVVDLQSKTIADYLIEKNIKVPSSSRYFVPNFKELPPILIQQGIELDRIKHE